MKPKFKIEHSRPDRILALLDRYRILNDEAEAEINDWVAELSRRSPGVPVDVLRMCELDARSNGYSYPLALERLHERLVNP